MGITLEPIDPEDPEFPRPLTGAERTRAHRERLREMGVPRTDRWRPDGRRVHQSQFIAWDGERGEDERDYALLGWNDGQGNYGSITGVSGGALTTQEILEFVAEVDARYVKPIHVMFAGGYDFNHWLVSLDRLELKRVHDRKKQGGRKYETIELAENYPVRLQVHMGKWFEFKLPTGKKHVKVYDVWGFFQSSFVKACDAFLIGKYGETVWFEHKMIRRMKLDRKNLGTMSPEDVDKYNQAELINLVRLMDTLREQASRVDLVPNMWHGPSPIAAKMLRQNNTQELHMSQYRTDDDSDGEYVSEIPTEVRRAARLAYAGGRAEMLKYGDIAGPVFSYDINSAYPAAMVELPSLKGGTWTHHRGNPQLRKLRKGEPGHFAVYRVQWKQDRSLNPGEHPAEYPGALPYRRHNGAMVWPLFGETWVWWPEFNAAQNSGTVSMEVLEAWVYQPPRSHGEFVRPFEFVAKRFTQRLELKARKDGGQIAIKLGLNSMYGRLAQQVGAATHHQLEWAGWVTSWCRAKVFEAAMQKPLSVVAFATDAVFTTEPLMLPIGEQLGEWEETVWDEFCNIQSGFYFGVQEDAKSEDNPLGLVRKSRGVDKDLPVEQLIRDHWDEGVVPMSREGFYSLGLALTQDFSKWRTWPRVRKDVKIGASTKRKFLQEFDDRGLRRSFVVAEPPCRQCGEVSFPVSHPHKLAWIADDRSRDMSVVELLRQQTGTESFTELDGDLMEKVIADDE